LPCITLAMPKSASLSVSPAQSTYDVQGTWFVLQCQGLPQSFQCTPCAMFDMYSQGTPATSSAVRHEMTLHFT
jgi:hypothetical protein